VTKSLRKGCRRLVDVFASYGLATVLFLFLLLLTYLGTLEQVESGLFATQKKYFESVFLIHEFFGVFPVPLPGVYLLLVLLFINLVCGGIVRMRKGWSQTGILITHLGILLLLVGGFVTFKYSNDGHMTLYEKQSSNAFKSYHDWEIAIGETLPSGEAVEHVIPGEEFSRLGAGESVTFSSGELPFELVISDYVENSRPKQKGPMFEVDHKVIDGVYLQPMKPEVQNEQNAAGAYAALRNESTGEEQELILWSFQQAPATATMDARVWTVDLRRKQWDLPFTIVLDKFTRELHPRTNMAKVFLSDVTKIEDGVEQQIKITMNEPLRHKGYTFFQASWGPANAGPNTPLFSTFAVVRNPADKFPLYACIVIGLGLCVHFSMKLQRHLRRENMRRA
jgi:ResB-like family protein